MVACVSAAGQFIPPMIIFKRMRMSDQLNEEALAGILATISKSVCSSVNGLLLSSNQQSKIRSSCCLIGTPHTAFGVHMRQRHR